MIPIKDTVLRREFPWMTWVIILLNSLVFLFETSLPADILERLIYTFGVVPAQLSGQESGLAHPASYLPLMTSMYLHGGWLHIIGNMWFLYLFGGSVEESIGHVRYFFFYTLCGISAALIYIFSDLQSAQPSIGASGAISGIMGAYIVTYPRARVLTLVPVVIIPFFFHLPAYLFLGFWFLIQIFSETYSHLSHQMHGGVAWWAHIGGFITGIILLLPFKARGKRAHQADEFHGYAR